MANTLSQYCAYLVKSAPELLPGPVAWTKRVYDCYADDAKKIEAYLRNTSDDPYKIYLTDWYKGSSHMDASNVDDPNRDHRIPNALILAKLLVRHSASSDELWKTLELVWVQLLVYAAPYGNSEAHMRHLAQGGEFITHLWALLYHLDIRQWKVQRKTLNEIATMEEAERIRKYSRYSLVAWITPPSSLPTAKLYVPLLSLAQLFIVLILIFISRLLLSSTPTF